jgi:hypothetical protein
MPVIRDQRQFGGVGPVGVVRMNTGGAEKYSRIAEATQQLTKVAISESARATEKSAIEQAEALDTARITTIDPKTGKPEALSAVANLGFIGRTGAEAYERVVQERFQQSIETEIKQKAGELALKYENDPYSADKYEEQMVSYLQNMAKTSEVGGQATAYTNFILNSGTQYITATKLNMMQEQIRRERAKTAQSISDNIEIGLDLAYNAGLAGTLPDDLVEAKVASARDGVASNLLNTNAENSTRTGMTVAYGEGVIVRMMDGLTTEQAVDLTNAFATADPSDLNATQRAIYNEATKRLGTVVDGEFVFDVSAIKSLAKTANAKAQEIKTDFSKRIIESRTRLLATSSETVSQSANVFGEIFDGSRNPLEAADRLNAWVGASLDALEGKGNDPYSGITVAEVNSLQSQIVKEVTKDAVIYAYNNMDGLPDEKRRKLERSLLEGTTEGLPDAAAAAVKTILKISPEYQEEGYVNSVVQKFSSSDEINNEQFKKNKIAKNIRDLDFFINQISSADYSTVNDLTRDALKVLDASSLSGVQKGAYERAINLAYFKSGISSGIKSDPNITSAQLSAAANYAAGNSDGTDIPAYLENQIDNLGDVVSSTDMVSELNNRAIRMAQVEAAQQEELETRQVLAQINSGQFPENSQKNREIVGDAIITASGRSDYFSSPEIYNPENPGTILLNKSLMSGVIPNQLLSSFESLSSGFLRSDAEAKNLLTLYSQFKSHPKGDEILNVWASTEMLNPKTRARLEAIHNVHVLTGTDITEIASNISANYANPTLKDNMALDFGEKGKPSSTANFVRRAVGEAAVSTSALTELVDVAEYLYAAGFPADKIETDLETYYDSIYKKTDGYVVDPQSTSGTRSRFALSVALPNKTIENFFIAKVNNELKAIGETVSLGNGAVLIPKGRTGGGGTTYIVARTGPSGAEAIGHPQYGMFAVSTDEQDVVEKAREELGLKINPLEVPMSVILQQRAEGFKNPYDTPSLPRSYQEGAPNIAGQ